ncbi:MAG: hypothetical protein LBS21_00635 [Clostridiales bacterium]|nr:hypothetical protein [Clostridiales bacterium]
MGNNSLRIGQYLFADFIEGFAREIEKEIPPFVTGAKRTYLKYQAYPQYSVLYWLADNGLLRYPTDEEAKRLCTIVWCEQQTVNAIAHAAIFPGGLPSVS